MRFLRVSIFDMHSAFRIRCAASVAHMRARPVDSTSMPTILSKRGRDAGTPHPMAAASTRVQIATVTAPPSSLGSPSYYTEYEEDRSNGNDTSPDDKDGTSTPRRVDPESQSAPKRKKNTNSAASTSKTKSKARKTQKSKAKGKDVQKSKPGEVISMKCTVQLTALAIEARFRNKRILKKFSTKNSNKQAQRALWEDTINIFQQRALAEQAWGDAKPREVFVKQFKHKLDTVRSGYKDRRQRMMAAGNCPVDDEDEDRDHKERKYPKMPVDFLLIGDDDEHSDCSSTDDDEPRTLACDPVTANLKYLKVLGPELTALWPLLCKVFSRRSDCTSESIIETGTGKGIESDDGANDELGNRLVVEYESLCRQKCTQHQGNLHCERQTLPLVHSFHLPKMERGSISRRLSFHEVVFEILNVAACYAS